LLSKKNASPAPDIAHQPPLNIIIFFVFSLFSPNSHSLFFISTFFLVCDGYPKIKKIKK